MGFLSKLFGKDKDDSDMYGDEKHYFEDGVPAPEPIKGQKVQLPAADAFGRELPWGDVMPHEENQYSFGGSYVDYFSKIFSEDLPEYQVTHEPTPYKRPGTRFTFTRGGRVVLYVEVISDKTTAYSFAVKCRNEGIPLLNFYYDHHGWWNVRSYVIGRVRNKLGV